MHWLVNVLLIAAPNAPALLFDHIVAWVDGETITQNELFAEAAITQIAEHGASALAQPMSEDTLRRALTELVSDLLVVREARRAGADPPSTQRIERAFAALLDCFSSRAAYAALVARLGVDDAFVLDGLVRRLSAEDYLSTRLRARLGGDAQMTADAQREKLADMAMAYRRELWRTVPIRLLQPHDDLERITQQ